MSEDRKWLMRLDDILKAIKEVEHSIEDHQTADSLYEDIESFRAVERNILIIAEASKHIPEPVKSDVTSVNWSNIVGMRNICLLYTSPSPRDGLLSRMPSSA